MEEQNPSYNRTLTLTHLDPVMILWALKRTELIDSHPKLHLSDKYIILYNDKNRKSLTCLNRFFEQLGSIYFNKSNVECKFCP